MVDAAPHAGYVNPSASAAALLTQGPPTIIAFCAVTSATSVSSFDTQTDIGVITPAPAAAVVTVVDAIAPKKTV